MKLAVISDIHGNLLALQAVLADMAQGWMVDLRAVPYDQLAQAAVAARNGREAWAHALATGFVRRPVGG